VAVNTIRTLTSLTDFKDIACEEECARVLSLRHQTTPFANLPLSSVSWQERICESSSSQEVNLVPSNDQEGRTCDLPRLLERVVHTSVTTRFA
jgi:hypothetical protein